eukprot:COSAG01_NODE_13410_length_1588_cov_1.851007_2_plen_154_part_00
MWGACTPPSRACRQITGGNAVFAVALRAGLDAAGFSSTLVDCCDSHGFPSGLTDHSSAFFKAVGALAVHEPLRNAESVPAAALATGKPIWSSESYTTCASAVAVGWPSCDRDGYQLPACPADMWARPRVDSNSNGGGCWARAINWGYHLQNKT